MLSSVKFFSSGAARDLATLSNRLSGHAVGARAKNHTRANSVSTWVDGKGDFSINGSAVVCPTHETNRRLRSVTHALSWQVRTVLRRGPSKLWSKMCLQQFLLPQRRKKWTRTR